MWRTGNDGGGRLPWSKASGSGNGPVIEKDKAEGYFLPGNRLYIMHIREAAARQLTT